MDRARARARFWYALIGFHFLVGRKWIGLGLGLGLGSGMLNWLSFPNTLLTPAIYQYMTEAPRVLHFSAFIMRRTAVGTLPL